MTPPHLNDDRLTLHYYGEDSEAEVTENHLSSCAECRGRLQALQQFLNSIAVPAPELSLDYEHRLWKRIAPGLSPRRRGAFLLWAAPLAAALLLAAFLAGRWTQTPVQPPTKVVADSQAQQRVLLIAVGDHLERSQMILAEITHAPDGKGSLNISEERTLAEDLLGANRLYRQTAAHSGDAGMTGILDDLEPVLLEIANSPESVSPAQLKVLQRQIAERGLVFKMRVIGSEIHHRQSESLTRKGTQSL